jgi:hypothetical protein
MPTWIWPIPIGVTVHDVVAGGGAGVAVSAEGADGAFADGD